MQWQPLSKYFIFKEKQLSFLALKINIHRDFHIMQLNFINSALVYTKKPLRSKTFIYK